MGQSRSRRNRRHRRQERARLQFGRGAAPKHTLTAGRTGGVHTRKLRSRGTRCRQDVDSIEFTKPMGESINAIYGVAKQE